MTRLRAGAATDVGLVRANNQDQLLVADPVFAVADGMGGHAAGEVASRTAVDALAVALGEGTGAEAVAEAVRSANRAVWDEAQANADFRGMGTTLTAIAVLAGDVADEVAVVNVGDSRTYRLRDGTLEQLTVDHSYVAELVAEGQIDAEEAEIHPQRHVLTRALGVAPDVDVDLLTLEARADDRFLLCSDGLSREVSDAQIASVLRRLVDPGDAARELVAEAKRHGGSDNITVVIVDIVDEGRVEAATQAIPVVVPAAATLAGGGDDAPTAATAAGTGESRRQRRRAAKAARPPRAKFVTFRVVLFFVLLLAIVGAAFGGTAYYARSTYFVGLRSSRIIIFQGRPGGLLWWKPTVAETTTTTTADIEAHNLVALRAGVQETSLAAAKAYVANLLAEKRLLDEVPATTVPTTTVPTTTVPTTTAPTTAPGRHRHPGTRTTVTTVRP